MSGEHTPGPWYPGHFVEDSHPCNCRSVISESHAGAICEIKIDNRKRIARGGNDAPPLEEAKANARLIAAAPEMLAALEAQVEHLKGFTDEELRRRDQLGIGGGYDRALIARAAIAKAKGQGT